VISQSLLELAHIYRGQHELERAEAMIAEVEPRLHRDLPPGHYAFAAITTERGLIAQERHDLPAALRLMDESVALIEAAVKAGGEGSFSLPGLYTYRSEIDLAMGHADQAEADADRALMALHPDQRPAGVSGKYGRVYLAKARALGSEGKVAQARATALQAFVQLQGSVGLEHPDTQSAKRLAR